MSDAHAGHGEHAESHPTWSTYWKVALILTIITVIEVWLYYLPSFVATPYFVPTLLVLSALKFAIVVLFYMHLKYDARLYRALFTGPFLIAMATIIVLMFLFGKFAIHLSLLQ
ncbi:MAG TPA: cytochrome C oxidase subunit IV family protein [Gemmatimonadaceae bacterium]|nr:cytochrome C oxidase subunit IV family protein [Gemmatimonadaceae bacterium]